MVFTRGKSYSRSFGFRGRPFRGRGRKRGNFTRDGDESHRIRDERSTNRDRDNRPRPFDRESSHEKGKPLSRREERDLREHLEEYDRPFRDRSISPARKRQHHPRLSPSPLRITVGNDIFYKEHSSRHRDSPFSENKPSEQSLERFPPLYKRLGPPVDEASRENDSPDYDRRYDSQNEHGVRRSSRDNKRHNSRSDMKEKYDERRNSSSWNKHHELKQSNLEHGRNKRNSRELYSDCNSVQPVERVSCSSPFIRENSWEKAWQGSQEQYYKNESYVKEDKEHYRQSEKNEREWSRERKNNKDQRETPTGYSRSPSEEEKESNRHLTEGKLQESLISQKINYYHGKPSPAEEVDWYLRSADKPDSYRAEPSLAKPSRPLKSILKKSGDQKQELIHTAYQMDSQENRYQQTYSESLTHESFLSQNIKENCDRKHVLAGLVAYDMDIEDEENFLYGEHQDNNKKSSSSFPTVNKNQISDEPSNGNSVPESSLPFWAAAAPRDSALSAKLFALHEKIHGPNPKRDSEWCIQTSDGDKCLSKTDGLDKSDNVKKDEDIDSTVQNILKSIGFDFELSKRMQELAKQKKEREQKKYGEPHIGISINQTASFLGGGISSDVRDDLFENNPPMHDVTSEKDANRQTLLRSHENMAKQFQNQEPKGIIDRHSKKQKINDDFDSLSESSDDNSKSSYAKPKRPHSEKKRSKSPEYGRHYEHDKSVENDQSPTSNQWAITSGNDWNQEYLLQPQTSQPYFDPHSIPPEYPHYYGQVSNPSQPQAVLLSYGSPITHGYPLYPDGSMPPVMFPPPGFPGYPGITPDMYSYPPQFVPSPSDSQKDRQKKSNTSNLTVVSLEDKKEDSPDEKKKEVTKSRSLEKKLSKPKQDKDLKTESSKLEREEDERNKSVESTRIVMPLKSNQKRKESASKYRSLSLEPMKKQVKVSNEKPKEVSPKHRLSPKERETLTKECDERKKKLEGLEREMEKLRKQQNEIMRKRRRQRDGHKDPLLVQNSKLQEEIAEQIKILRKAADASSDVLKNKDSEKRSCTGSKKDNNVSSKRSEKQSTREDLLKLDKKDNEKKVNYQYFDAGHHWCRSCNHVTLSVFEYLSHLQSKKHQQRSDPFERPWLESTLNDLDKKLPEGPCQTCPLKGVEFMMSVSAFYCSLCKEFSGDVTCASAHLKSDKHNNNYKGYMEKNPFYEKRLMIERTAYLSEKKEKDDKYNKQDILTNSVSTETNKKKEIKQEKAESMTNETVGFGKFSHKEEQKKKSTEPKDKDDKKSDLKKKEEKPKVETKESTGKIPIKLTGKTVIKQPSKILPPWTPVTRKIPQKKPKDDLLAKKNVKPQVEEPPSLDEFLTIGPATADGKLPVVKDIEAIPHPNNASNDSPSSQHLDQEIIAKAFRGQLNPDDLEKEKVEELKYLGIEEVKELEIKPKPPPPPSQNMCLPEEKSECWGTSLPNAVKNGTFQNENYELSVEENSRTVNKLSDISLKNDTSETENNEIFSEVDVTNNNSQSVSTSFGFSDCETEPKEKNTNNDENIVQNTIASASVSEFRTVFEEKQNSEENFCPVIPDVNRGAPLDGQISEEKMVQSRNTSQNLHLIENICTVKNEIPEDNNTKSEQSDDGSADSIDTTTQISGESVSQSLSDNLANDCKNSNGNINKNNNSPLNQEICILVLSQGSTVSSTTISESAMLSRNSVMENNMPMVQSSTDVQTFQTDIHNSINIADNSDTSASNVLMRPEMEGANTVDCTVQEQIICELNEQRADTTSSGRGFMPAELKVPDAGNITTDDKIKADTTSISRQYLDEAESASAKTLSADEDNNKDFSEESNESKADTTSSVSTVHISNQENISTSEVDVQVHTSELNTFMVDSDFGRNAVSTSNETNCEQAKYICTSVGDTDLQNENRTELENTVGTSSRSKRKENLNTKESHVDCTEAVGISLEISGEGHNNEFSELSASATAATEESIADQTQSGEVSKTVINLETAVVSADETVSSDVQSSTQIYFDDPFICSQSESVREIDVELSSASTCTSSTNNWTDVVSHAFAAIANLAESTSEVMIFSPNNSKNLVLPASGSQDAITQSSTECHITNTAVIETCINSEAVQVEGMPLIESQEVVHSTTHSNRDSSALNEKEIVGTSSETFASNVVVDSTEVDTNETVENEITQNEPDVDSCDLVSQTSEASLINMGSDFEVIDECQSD